MKFAEFIKSYWPSLLTLAVILYATLWPDPEVPETVFLFPHVDKLIHAIMFGGLFGAIVFDTRRRNRRMGLRPCNVSQSTLLRIGLILLIFSVVDEFLQKALTTTRSADIWDIMADWGGILIAFIIAPPVVRWVLPANKN